MTIQLADGLDVSGPGRVYRRRHGPCVRHRPRWQRWKSALTRYQELGPSVLFTGNLGNVPRLEVLATLPWRAALTCDLPQQSIELIGTPAACQLEPGQSILATADGE